MKPHVHQEQKRIKSRQELVRKRKWEKPRKVDMSASDSVLPLE